MKKMSSRRLWGFDHGDRKLLLGATAERPDLREIVARAELHEEIEGLWIVWATGYELDEVYSLIEALRDRARSGKRRDQLQGMLASLCTAIDGF